jgi:methyl-accepting chemotaxis protein
MISINRLTVKRRLTFGFGAVLLMIVLLTVIGIFKVRYIDQALTEITDINSLKQRYAINYRGSVHDRAIAIRDVIQSRDQSELTQFTNEIRQLETFYEESEVLMKQMISSGVEFTSQERNILADIDRAQTKTLAIVQKIFDMQKKQQREELRGIILDEGRIAFIDWLGAINQFIDYQEAQNKISTDVARNHAGGFQNIMLIISVIATAIGMILGYTIQNSLYCSLGGEPKEAAESLNTIADGDLTQDIRVTHDKSMLSSMARMQTRLKSIVTNITNASGDLNQQANSVAEGSEQIIKTAKKQHVLTEQVTGDLQDMQNTVAKVSERAGQNKESAQGMVERANNGLEAINASAKTMEKVTTEVSKTVEQIRNLEELASQIGGITSVINGVSEQTNLLALNAAIEAARAGESGRGFAVVADEVRQLALRTSEATAEIASTVEKVQNETAQAVHSMQDTLPHVEQGKERTVKAMNLLQEIEQHASHLLSNAGTNAESAKEQATRITSIAEIVVELDSMSKNSLQSLDSNKRSLDSLNKLSENLNNDVGFFKLT